MDLSLATLTRSDDWWDPFKVRDNVTKYFVAKEGLEQTERETSVDDALLALRVEM